MIAQLARESEEAANGNQHEDAGEGTSRQAAAVQSKKRKVRGIQDEHRKYQEKWTDKFLFVLHGMTPLCLICRQTRACFKRSSLEHHFKKAHPKFNESYPPGISEVIMANHLVSESTPEIKDALQKNDQALAATYIKEYLKEAANTPLNIGITGESGSGKSSFVNAFRGIDHRDERAAPTGCVETTTAVKAYPHPNYANVTLWDLPGIGTTKFPADKYLKHVRFEKFDIFIIISDTCFRENDMTLRRWRRSSTLCAPKLTMIFKLHKEVRGTLMQKALWRKSGKTAFKVCVKSPQVFLLSNFELQLHYFHHLHETLEKELPAQKRGDVLFAKISIYAFLSAAGAAVPVSGLSVAVDGSLMAGVVREYKAEFGLDGPSLKRLTDSIGVSLKDPMVVISSPLTLNNINVDFILGLLLQGRFDFIPIFGTVVAATLSYKVTEKSLENFLDMLAEEPQRVFKRALETSLPSMGLNSFEMD
uniref:IRG-type G domain-containing protein n=1 Tax=Mola mola TaxID=94237 RepID=A0A3Q3X6Y0_MOLML